MRKEKRNGKKTSTKKGKVRKNVLRGGGSQERESPPSKEAGNGRTSKVLVNGKGRGSVEEFDKSFAAAPNGTMKKRAPVDESQWLLFGIKHKTQGYHYEYGATREHAIERHGWNPADVVYCLDMSGLEDKKATPENAGTKHSITVAVVPMSIEEREMKMSKETLMRLRQRREEIATKKPVLTGLAAYNAKRAAEKAAEGKKELTAKEKTALIETMVKVKPEESVIPKHKRHAHFCPVHKKEFTHTSSEPCRTGDMVCVACEVKEKKERITKEQEQHLFGKDKKAEKYMALSPGFFGFGSTIVDAKKNLKKSGGDIGRKCGIYLVPGDYYIDAMGNAHGSSVGRFLSGKDYRKGLEVVAPKGDRAGKPKSPKGDSISTPKAQEKKKAANGTNGEFRKNTIVIFGQHTVTGVLRWMGKEGFEFNEAQSAFKKMKLKREPTDLCILTYLYRGKKGVGDPAKLTGDQQKILRASLEKKAGK
jgi:hypothetical protein